MLKTKANLSDFNLNLLKDDFKHFHVCFKLFYVLEPSQIKTFIDSLPLVHLFALKGLADVPKGKIRSYGEMTLKISDSGNRIQKISGGENFGGSVLSR